MKCSWSKSGSGFYQCCGSGSGIRCLFDPWIRDGRKVKIPDPGWTTLIIFPRAWNSFLGLKYLNFLMRIRYGKNSDPGWKNSNPGSGINIPDPRHWILWKRTFEKLFLILFRRRPKEKAKQTSWRSRWKPCKAEERNSSNSWTTAFSSEETGWVRGKHGNYENSFSSTTVKKKTDEL